MDCVDLNVKTLTVTLVSGSGSNSKCDTPSLKVISNRISPRAPVCAVSRPVEIVNDCRMYTKSNC